MCIYFENLIRFFAHTQYVCSWYVFFCLFSFVYLQYAGSANTLQDADLGERFSVHAFARRLKLELNTCWLGGWLRGWRLWCDYVARLAGWSSLWFLFVCREYDMVAWAESHDEFMFSARSAWATDLMLSLLLTYIRVCIQHTLRGCMHESSGRNCRLLILRTVIQIIFGTW